MGDDLTRRRTVIAGVGASGLALALTACGGTDTAGSATGSSTASATAPTAGSGGTGSAQPGAGQGAGQGALATTADIPVGGGTVFKEQKVVVTQPTAGQFKAFSAVCTHRGCVVAAVAEGLIGCPCHGSKFKIEDGSVANGPADKPLPEQQIKVEGDQITLA